MRKVYICQYTEMMVIRNNKLSIGFNGTIYKFVVIIIRLDKMKVVKHLHQTSVIPIQDGIDNTMGNLLRLCLLCNNLLVFIQNVICYTKTILTRYEITPYRVVTAISFDSSHKAVCI